MYYVYLLQDTDNKIYIGYTADQRRRVQEHQGGKSYWTSRMNEPQLIYYEAYQSQSMAREREKNLKKRSSAYIGLIKRIGLKQ